jgi:ribosomal protein L30E
MFIKNKIEHFNKLAEVVVYKFKALLYPEGILL